MRPHTPARVFLLSLVAGVFVIALGLGIGSPVLAVCGYLVGLVGLLVMSWRRGQKAPDEPSTAAP